MCGIYGLLSARGPSAPAGDEVFLYLDDLIDATEPQGLLQTLSDDSAVRGIFDRLENVREAAGRCASRSFFLSLFSEPARADRLRGAVARIEKWLGRLESLLESGRATRQAYHEMLNRLIVGGKDVAWQLERDVLGNMDAVRELVDEPDPLALGRAYELNLTLRSLDRLEVRGRDSAGIAVYVRFGSPDSLDEFLDRPGGEMNWRRELESRADPRLGHGAVVRPTGARNTLLFAFKVASEVGKMGDNVASLRRSITEDALFRALLREPEVDVQALGHTRWASNGVISPPNCHPVDSALLREGAVSPSTQGVVVACLNGDIDNYQDLVDRYVRGFGHEIDPAITTDAKIVPVVVAHHYRETGDLSEAFRRAFDEFEGSMAIALMAADAPGVLFLGQKGSGQGLFFGKGAESIAAASEMYGVVELSSVYVKAEGEREEHGEVFRLERTERGARLSSFHERSFREVPDARLKRAEITTRDINRGSFPHFFLKEITESVASVRNTLRGKFEVSETGHVRFLLGPDVLPLELVAGLREGRVIHVVVVGQGTAAVAAQGVAHLVAEALSGSPHPLDVTAEKASEFSAHHLRDDMSDTLIIAVSQSGTTTDTNRTVDLARKRGAWVLSIVNRRNSDLVYKSHGVLYTSDGRDIEMSVASTKAFYAQNVAGQVLALGLASALDTLGDEDLRVAVSELHSLPGVLEKTLELEPEIEELARRFALRRRHWAVVGSGPTKIAADEIRIKLSELCYKSIAVDYLEDKKHIDLSSEPLVIVCAGGLREEIKADAVKEVAIFKAHQAIPLVIAEEGDHEFDPYAAGTVRVPPSRNVLGYLPATMVGHLFGYHAAAVMDEVADRLRAARGEIVRLQEERHAGDEESGEIFQMLPRELLAPLAEVEAMVGRGEADGALPAGIAVRLFRALQLLLGRAGVDAFLQQSEGSVLASVLRVLSESIAELARPIDAIKHQAKTVTVGISRLEAVPAGGPLWDTFRELDLPAGAVLTSHRMLLTALEPLVDRVEGATLYRLSRLDELGRPTGESGIRVERKLGSADRMPSRCESERPLKGNKWAVVKHREVYLGYGQLDGKKILILPVVAESTSGQLLLYHLRLREGGSREARLKALKARGKFLDRLQAAVTERNLEWDVSLIDSLQNDTLFFQPPERIAEELAKAVGRGEATAASPQ